MKYTFQILTLLYYNWFIAYNCELFSKSQELNLPFIFILFIFYLFFKIKSAQSDIFWNKY